MGPGVTARRQEPLEPLPVARRRVLAAVARRGPQPGSGIRAAASIPRRRAPTPGGRRRRGIRRCRHGIRRGGSCRQWTAHVHHTPAPSRGCRPAPPARVPGGRARGSRGTGVVVAEREGRGAGRRGRGRREGAAAPHVDPAAAAVDPRGSGELEAGCAGGREEEGCYTGSQREQGVGREGRRWGARGPHFAGRRRSCARHG